MDVERIGSLFRSPGNGVDLGPGSNLPEGWTAAQVIYLKLGIKLEEGELSFFYCAGGVIANGSIADFKTNRLNASLAFSSPTPPSAASLNVDITDRCYVVIELSDEWNWRFFSKGPGIKTVDDHRTQYCDLVHLDVDGNAVADVTQDHVSRCLYFSVADVGVGDHAFNLYVELVKQGGAALPLILDPDIHNDGGRGSSQRPTAATNLASASARPAEVEPVD